MILNKLNAYTTIKPLTGSVPIVRSIPLSSPGVAGPTVASGVATGSLYVGPLCALALKSAARVQHKSNSETRTSPTARAEEVRPASEFKWSEAIEKIGKGAVAAGVPLTLTTLPNVTTAAELSKTLVTYNVAPNSAKSLSDALFASLKSESGFAVCVGAAGGIFTLFVLDAAKVRWSLATKLLVAVAVAIALGIVAAILVEKGVLQKPGSNETSTSQSTAPSK